MNHTSGPIWFDGETKPSFPRFSGSQTCDVVIAGGGITGITAAYLLVKAGKKVIVLESLQPGEGTTGHSTGNLYCTVDSRLSKLKKKYELDTLKKILKSRQEAMETVRSIIDQEGIDCAEKRVPWSLIAEHDKDISVIEEEYDILKECGINARMVNDLSLPINVRKAVIVEDQIQMNPYAYVVKLAEKAGSHGVQIFGESPVTDWEENKVGVTVKTESGTIRADHFIMATHTPKGFHTVQTLLGPYREFGVTAATNGPVVPDGIWWVNGSRHHHSLRNHKIGNRDYLIVIGEHFKTGQNEHTQEGIKATEDFLKRCGYPDISHSWGAQHYRAADEIPYIGRNDDDSRLYHATGFATDGLTYGTLSAMIITDSILDKKNPYEELYAISRHQPAKAAKNFIKENFNVAGEYLKDLFTGTDEFTSVKAGEGKIVELKGKKVAAYRDETGKLSLVSAFCTHMKCVVNFNEAEVTWDCPCHGSRFTTNGEVIEGPAVHNLENRYPDKENFQEK